MLSWKDYLVAREHYKDLLREAEQERLARQAMAGGESDPHLYCRMLAWLGRRLVNWGLRLQKRYGALDVPSIASNSRPRPANG
jgi:hypothetical protein